MQLQPGLDWARESGRRPARTRGFACSSIVPAVAVAVGLDRVRHRPRRPQPKQQDAGQDGAVAPAADHRTGSACTGRTSEYTTQGKPPLARRDCQLTSGDVRPNRRGSDVTCASLFTRPINQFVDA